MTPPIDSEQDLIKMLEHKAFVTGDENVMKQLDKRFKGKKFCRGCRSCYHPEQFKTCWDCHAKNFKEVTKSYES